MNRESLWIWFKSTHAFTYIMTGLRMIKWHRVDVTKKGTIYINVTDRDEKNINEEIVKRTIMHDGDVLYLKKILPIPKEMLKKVYNAPYYEENDLSEIQIESLHQKAFFINKLIVRRFKKMRLSHPIIVIDEVSDFIEDYKEIALDEKKSLLRNSYEQVMSSGKQDDIRDMHTFFQALINEVGGKIVYIESKDPETKYTLKKLGKKIMFL